MKLLFKPFYLLFKHPFGVSSNTRMQTPTVFVKIEDQGFIGYGEACVPIYLGESIEETIQFFEKAKLIIEKINSKIAIDEICKELDVLSPSCNAAKAAMNIALNDLYSKSENKTFCNWKKIPHRNNFPTSFTIGIDNKEKIVQKIKEASEYEILKIKAGTQDDKELISFIRGYTQKPLFIDVNQGWKNAEYAIEMIEWLGDKNVLLIEQPLPKEMKQDMKWLTARSAIPTFADESVKTLGDLEELNDEFSGINIKLMKCKGINEALKMIAFCKQNNLKVFLGCMAESSCATAAMAQLAHFADFIDLDAPQLYTNDPFAGINYYKGNLLLNEKPGIGIEPNLNLDF